MIDGWKGVPAGWCRLRSNTRPATAPTANTSAATGDTTASIHYISNQGQGTGLLETQ